MDAHSMSEGNFEKRKEKQYKRNTKNSLQQSMGKQQYKVSYRSERKARWSRRKLIVYLKGMY